MKDLGGGGKEGSAGTRKLKRFWFEKQYDVIDTVRSRSLPRSTQNLSVSNMLAPAFTCSDLKTSQVNRPPIMLCNLPETFSMRCERWSLGCVMVKNSKAFCLASATIGEMFLAPSQPRVTLPEPLRGPDF